MVTFIIVLVIVGLIAGAIARLLLPGRDPHGIFGPIVLGILGSFVGGFLQNLVQHHSLSIHSFHLVGIIGSIIGAFVLLLLLRLFRVQGPLPRRPAPPSLTVLRDEGAGTPGGGPAAALPRRACSGRYRGPPCRAGTA